MEGLFQALDENSIAYVAMNSWVPSLITVVVGGYMVSILFPRLQRRSQRGTQIEEKKVAIAEDIVQSFNRYIVSWRRLIQIAELGQSRELSDDECERLQQFVEDRKECRDGLMDNLRLCQLYFCDGLCSEVQRFIDWDERQAAKSLEELPSLDEWRAHEESLVGLIKNEIR